MKERRRFLQVLGATAVASACAPDESETGSGSPTSTTSGDDTASSSSDAASSSSASSSDAASSSSAGGAGPSGSSTSAGGGAPNNFTVVANVGDISEGTLTMVKSASLLLGRDAGGVYAMTSLCSHKQCDMCIKGALIATGIRCTCHNSKFDLNGSVTAAPATKPLAHFDCIVSANGEVGVDKTKNVPADFRAPIP